MEQAERKLIRNVTVRMPESLAERLEAHARLNHRSMHGEILYHLERAVSEGGSPARTETMVEMPAKNVPFVGAEEPTP